MSKKTTRPRRVIVRTYSAGVHFGDLVSRDGKDVVLANAKRIWRWVGAWTLNEVAAKGVSDASKISCAVPRIELTEAIEIIDCTPEAAACLEGASWRQ